MEAKLNIRKNAKCYYVRLTWYDANGKRKQTEVSTGIPAEGDNKRKAKKKMEEIKEEYKKKYETTNLIDTHNILFSEYMGIWLENHKRNIRKSTYEGYKGMIESQIIPYFEKKGIALIDLQPIHIDSYYSHLIKNGRSANTVRHHHANIRKALQCAFLQNMIPYNPADRVETPKVKPYEAEVFTLEEMAKILDLVKGMAIEPAIILAVYYAMRRSEICGLCWEDIDFESKTIHICRTRTKMLSELFEENTKSRSGNRILALTPEIEEFLLSLKEKQKEYKKLFGNTYNDNDFVCKWENGEPLKCDYISNRFRHILKNNNMRIIKFHSLRHSCATALVNSNEVSLATVQAMLGHSTLDMTRKYIHPDMQEKIKAANSVSNLIKKAQTVVKVG